MNSLVFKNVDEITCAIASTLDAIEEIALALDDRHKTQIHNCLNGSILYAKFRLDQLDQVITSTLEK